MQKDYGKEKEIIMSYCPYCDQLRGPFYPDERICLCKREEKQSDLSEDLKDDPT